MVLSYHDVSLRQSDLDLLPPPNWFNDQLIAFWFEYLAQDKHPELQQEVALLPGATTFLLSNVAPEEAGLVFESLKVCARPSECCQRRQPAPRGVALCPFSVPGCAVELLTATITLG